ncbi:hypothetical protein Prudu_013836 [Prunus dulcis]|uniref:ATP-dependent Clp protease proteolytic subunit n=1 Tax=Prunus dulcis TaxID=3755 RepID=A0A4Y1RFT8_PRUDU|nr:hypothetical protein Prudu_013836 [Prunus dulcis]
MHTVYALLRVKIRPIWICTYRTRVMIHQPAASFYEAQTGEFILEAEELLKLRETLTRVYAQRTGKPLWVVSEDMERDSLQDQQFHELGLLLLT